MKYLFTTLILVFLGSIQLLGQTVVDFTDPATPTFGTNARKIVDVNGTDVAVMWGGDLDGDGVVSYTGDLNRGNPTDPGNAGLLSIILSDGDNFFITRTYTFQAYSGADFDMDGVVSYTGDLSNGSPTAPGNAWLLSAVLAHPDNFFITRTFTFKQQMP